MLNFSQQNRLLQLSSSAFSENDLHATEFTGIEKISSLFGFSLSAFTADPNLDVTKLIGNPITVLVTLSNNKRYFNGIVSQVKRLKSTMNNTIHYQITLKPWAWFLQFPRNVKRFENKTPAQIITAICKGVDFAAIDAGRLTKTYPALSYAIQYNEPAFEFIQRILNEQGIYYYFTHTQDKHILVLVDQFNDYVNPQTLNYSNSENYDFHIDSWQQQTQWAINKVAATDYNSETATTDLTVGNASKDTTNIVGKSNWEYFIFPGDHQTVAEGKQKSQQNVNQKASERVSTTAASNIITLGPGLRFDLANHPQAEYSMDYLIVNVKHHAHDHSHMPYANHGDEPSQFYRNYFDVIPAPAALATPPLEKIPTKPVSSQAAVVAGQQPDTLNTDALGRTKLDFNWQHSDDTVLTTHEVDVLQPVAGSNWGSQFLPRVGDEVYLRYLYGDPKKPIIMGGLHNADRLPYYALPNQQTKWGITTFAQHELTFTDTKAQESFLFASSKDMTLQSQKDVTTTIEQDSNHKTAGDYSQHSQTHTLEAKQQINLAASGSGISITPNKISVGGPQTELEASGSGRSELVDVAMLVGGIFLDEIGVGEAIQADAIEDIAAKKVSEAVPSISGKVEKQMTKRGWTKSDIDQTISNPNKTIKTRDTRWRDDGSKNDEPATAYIDKDGHYVVKNDKTGDIVQLSDKKSTDWKPTHDIEK